MCSIRPCFNIKGICRHSIFFCYFIFYFLFYSIYVFHENVRYKANYKKNIYIKNIVSKCPEHSLTDLDMHTPLHYVQETKKEIDTY